MAATTRRLRALASMTSRRAAPIAIVASQPRVAGQPQRPQLAPAWWPSAQRITATQSRTTATARIPGMAATATVQNTVCLAVGILVAVSAHHRQCCRVNSTILASQTTRVTRIMLFTTPEMHARPRVASRSRQPATGRTSASRRVSSSATPRWPGAMPSRWARHMPVLCSSTHLAQPYT